MVQILHFLLLLLFDAVKKLAKVIFNLIFLESLRCGFDTDFSITCRGIEGWLRNVESLAEFIAESSNNVVGNVSEPLFKLCFTQFRSDEFFLETSVFFFQLINFLPLLSFRHLIKLR